MCVQAFLLFQHSEMSDVDIKMRSGTPSQGPVALWQVVSARPLAKTPILLCTVGLYLKCQPHWASERLGLEWLPRSLLSLWYFMSLCVHLVLVWLSQWQIPTSQTACSWKPLTYLEFLWPLSDLVFDLSSWLHFSKYSSFPSMSR